MVATDRHIFNQYGIRVPQRDDLGERPHFLSGDAVPGRQGWMRGKHPLQGWLLPMPDPEGGCRFRS